MSVKENYGALVNRINQVSGTTMSLKTTLKEMQITFLDQKKRHTEALKDMERKVHVQEILKKLSELCGEKAIKNLEDMLTAAVKAVFSDRFYSVKIEVSDRGASKLAELYLVEKREGKDDLVMKVRDSVGGGVATIISLVLRIYFIINLRQRRFLLIDEALGAVSSQYLEPLYGFLKICSQKLGFVFLVVSHNPNHDQFSDHTYEMLAGNVKKIQ